MLEMNNKGLSMCIHVHINAQQLFSFALAFTFQLHRASKFDIDEGPGSFQDLSEHAYSLKHAQTYTHMYALLDCQMSELFQIS